MTRELPADREKALEAIAAGWTRQPTTAHPECLCGGRAEYTPVSYTERAGRLRAHATSTYPKTVPCPIHSGRR